MYWSGITSDNMLNTLPTIMSSRNRSVSGEKSVAKSRIMCAMSAKKLCFEETLLRSKNIGRFQGDNSVYCVDYEALYGRCERPSC
mmetsp:Transcript_3032/g.4670  ORF Transcript_3032/g.4670 Transcript_3032/m.4670 type:complete len:85 (+) Transcript_3032:751-1005(+)